MPKILFIQPTQYGSDGYLCKQKKIHLPGLVFPLLAAITPSHWEVELCIEVVENIPFDTNADLIGIGSMGHAVFRGIEIAEKFRKQGKTVVMGGYMVSIAAQEVLKFVDSLIIGDAEISYPQMLKDFETHGKLKPIYDNPVTHLNNLPIPNYDLIVKKPISSMLPVQAGRGCPMSCSFCSIACLYKGKYLFRPVEDVIRDIKEVKRLGFKRFYLIDDNIVSNSDYLKELCKKIKPLNMSWASQCSIQLADNPDLMKAVSESGGNLLSFGIESIGQEGLNKLGKSWLKVQDHERLIKLITQFRIMVSAEMIVGTDSDTEKSIIETYHFINRARIPIPRIYILTPIPGTALFTQYKKEGRLLTNDLKSFDGSRCVHRPLKIEPEKLTEMYWWLNNKVFSLKSILFRTLFNPSAIKQPILYIFAFFVNLHYRRYVKKKTVPNIL